MKSEPATTTAREVDTVPVDWPALRTDVPAPAKTVPALLALPGMVLLWLSPRRFGGSLAATGWGSAVTVNLFALVTGLGLISWADRASEIFGRHVPSRFSSIPDVPDLSRSFTELARAPYASFVEVIHDSRSSGNNNLLEIACVMGIAEAILLAAALFLMLCAAAGEPLGRLFTRCWRLALWSATMVIPLGIGWLIFHLGYEWLSGRTGLGILDGYFPTPRRSEIVEKWAHAARYILLAIWLLWYLIVLLRSGLRYAGPADGPAWQARRPRCRQCGYILSGLLMTGKCPECGTAIAESMAAMEQAGRFTHWRAFKLSVQAALSRGRADG